MNAKRQGRKGGRKEESGEEVKNRESNLLYCNRLFSLHESVLLVYSQNFKKLNFNHLVQFFTICIYIEKLYQSRKINGKFETAHSLLPTVFFLPIKGYTFRRKPSECYIYSVFVTIDVLLDHLSIIIYYSIKTV